MSARMLRPARGPGPAVRTLLLHGLGGSHRAWDGFVPRAGDALELWHARLPWSADGTAEWAYTSDAASWLEAPLRHVEPDLVIAHSLAAGALLDLLTREPDHSIAGVVLVTPLFHDGERPFDWSRIGHGAEQFPLVLQAGIAERYGRVLPPAVQRRLALKLRDLLGPMAWMRILEVYLRSAVLDLSRLKVPCLVIAGELDEAAPAADARRLAGRLPDGRFVTFAGSGHFPMFDRPAEFAEAVGRLAADLPSGRC
jgi:pimeloyl-ACP methyl ester carboxylesterase